MNRYLLQFDCDNMLANRNNNYPPENIINLKTTEDTKGNVRAKIQFLHDSCKLSITGIMEDLLRLATCCLESDKIIHRGTENDLSLSNWERELHVTASVCNSEFWNLAKTKQLLSDYLNYLTGDDWHFEFINDRQPGWASTLFRGIGENPDGAELNEVLLFSGGLDSLCSLLIKINEGKKPLLASHIPNYNISSIQKELLTYIRNRYNKCNLPHIAYCSNAIGGNKHERTQRSRSFLYASLGLVMAISNGISKISIPDNGIISLNLPRLSQSICARNSRSTHPISLYKFKKLADHLTNIDVEIDNPIKFYTRAEVIKKIEELGYGELIEKTSSCTSLRQTTKSIPNCGTCSQCIDRRFGMEIAKSRSELPGRYIKDIFKSELINYKEKLQALSYVQWAQEIHELDENQIFDKHPELADIFALTNIEPLEDGPKYLDLLARHSSGVVNIMNEKISEANLATSKLPDNCLLRLVAGKQKVDTRVLCIDEIKTKLRKSLPLLPRWKELEDENELNQSINALLKIGVENEFYREVPLLPFAGISTKPDLMSEVKHGYIYIEGKYPKKRKDVNHIVTEITSRMLIYREYEAFVLFVIADPGLNIPDIDKFNRDVGSQFGCWTTVIR